MLTKVCPLSDFKMAAESGEFTGYASVFGLVDSQNDVVIKGAFAENLPAFVQNGHVLLNHDAAQSIGTIRDAAEDSYGLLVNGEFLSSDIGQRARVMLADRIARGKTAAAMSIGFRPLAQRRRKDNVVELTKIALAEVSILTVPRPANAQAQVIGVKGRGPDEQWQRFEALEAKWTQPGDHVTEALKHQAGPQGRIWALNYTADKVKREYGGNAAARHFEYEYKRALRDYLWMHSEANGRAKQRQCDYF